MNASMENARSARRHLDELRYLLSYKPWNAASRQQMLKRLANALAFVEAAETQCPYESEFCDANAIVSLTVRTHETVRVQL